MAENLKIILIEIFIVLLPKLKNMWSFMTFYKKIGKLNEVSEFLLFFDKITLIEEITIECDRTDFYMYI